jgi:uncharacterized protein (DUF1697 family)
MSLVLFLRGVNVGGNRTFRPAQLPARVPHLALENLGAAGTFIARAPLPAAEVVAAVAQALPFENPIITCPGERILRLVRDNPLKRYAGDTTITRFVGFLGAPLEAEPILPIEFKDGRRWLIRVLELRDDMVLGAYRREPKTISMLGRVDRLFDVPITVRNWNTVEAIAKRLAPPA